jgi:hypothetical protein
MTVATNIYTEILPLDLGLAGGTQITDGPEHMQVEMVPFTAAAA